MSRATLVQMALLCGALCASTTLAMPPAPAGYMEAGVPAFVVMGPEALGLSTAPTDLHVLPDGRVLVVSQSELAFGDGVRWESFRGMQDQENLLTQVTVDTDGQIYAGTLDSISAIHLKEGSRWEFSLVQKLPDGAKEQIPRKVAMLPSRWFWFGGSDAVFSWRPGAELTFAGRFGTIDQIFELNREAYLSDLSSGKLHRLKTDGTSEQVGGTTEVVSESVTCAIPFGDNRLLVGTVSAGLQIFDGKTFRPFGPASASHAGRRITDLCMTVDGYVAVAVDSIGIVFQDRDGNTVQVLGRSLDHRLARVVRLAYAPSGVLWGLLNEGVVRVEFPSPVSRFEPLINGSLFYPRPLRHDGELWIMADGRAMQGQYDQDNRLERFVDRTPPGRYLAALTAIDDTLFGTNDAGIYLFEDNLWKEVVKGIVNARLGVAADATRRIYFVARGEYGWIEKTNDGYSVRRIPMPELGDSYGSAVDAAGIGWIELGTGLVGRFDAHQAEPKVELIGTGESRARDWVEIFVLEGVARFHISNIHYRFSETTRSLVEDRDLLERHPRLVNAGGRPVMDRLQRLWFTSEGAPHVIDYSPSGGMSAIPIPPIDFFPTIYTLEENGVAWLSDRRRLARVDLRLPSPPQLRLQALITSVQFAASGRQLFAPGPSLHDLDYSDNSLVIHFAAPANPFARPVTFEVLLEGSGTKWVSTGTVGSAAFNRLKEGNYVFRVRPVARGSAPGGEARVAFTVRPPWYRTNIAWVVYVASAAGFVGTAAWLSSFLQRRENERLERVVTERTRELNATNSQLGRQIVETTEKSAALSASEERYRTLNTQLEQRVAMRTAELSHSNAELQHRESLFRLVFEHAPVGLSWKRADLGDVFHLNPTFRRILSLSHDELMDHTLLAKLVHPEDAERQIALARSIATGASNSFNLEERFVLADGRIIWGSLSVAVVRDASGSIVQEIGILEDITLRKQAEEELAATYKNLVATSRIAGMAEVATGVLHNVGNVLNSLNVSANLIADANQQSKVTTLVKLSALVDQHAADLGTFLTSDPKGKLIPGVLQRLAENSLVEREWFATEIAAMQKNIDYIKAIIAMQQDYASTAGVVEKLAASTLLEDALRMSEPNLSDYQIKVVRRFSPVPPITVEKDKVLQILINLIHNAREACDELPGNVRSEKIITLGIEPGQPGEVRLSVRDNGVGIPPENLTRIFSHGFTTRPNGHGFALHTSILAARAMKGTLTAHSDGPGKGAEFVLILPIMPPASAGTGAGLAEFPELNRFSTVDAATVT